MCVAPRLVFMLFSVNVFIGDTLVLSMYSSCSSVGGLVVERYLVSPVCALLIMYVCLLEVDILVRQYSPGGRATVCWTCWGIFMLSPGFQFGVSSEFVLRPPIGCVFVIGVRPYMTRSVGPWASLFVILASSQYCLMSGVVESVFACRCSSAILVYWTVSCRPLSL